MKDLIVYVHGKGGSAQEAEHYKSLFPKDEVIGFDYRSQTPWQAKKEFFAFFTEQRGRCEHLTLVANSIGAFFALSSLDETLVDRAYFISPIVDMENLICNMMQWSNVTKQELAEKRKSPRFQEKRCHGSIFAMCASTRLSGMSLPVFSTVSMTT